MYSHTSQQGKREQELNQKPRDQGSTQNHQKEEKAMKLRFKKLEDEIAKEENNLLALQEKLCLEEVYSKMSPLMFFFSLLMILGASLIP